MAKSLDFNSFIQPTLPVTFADAEKTAVHVTTPSVKLIERLEANVGELQDLAVNKSPETIKACYDLAGELISCNTEGKPVTGDDLRDKYNVNLLGLVTFYSVYLDFIREIKTVKN